MSVYVYNDEVVVPRSYKRNLSCVQEIQVHAETKKNRIPEMRLITNKHIQVIA